MTNELYYGDNLDVLRKSVKSETVDLCYIDPPFNSKRNYFQIYNNQGGEDRAQVQAFVDTWNWGDEAVEGIDYILSIDRLHGGADATRWTEQTVELIRGLEKVLGRGSLLAYLVHMTLRIVEIHRVLKSTGSFYLHCDPTASHYLKLVLDAVFCGQGGDYIGEIIWRRTSGKVGSKRWPRHHDVILNYAKNTDLAIFNSLKVAADAGWVEREYRHYDERGRYSLDNLTGAGTTKGPSGQPWRGVDPAVIGAGRHWRYVPETLDRLDSDGRIYWPKKGRYPKLKQYLEESNGTTLGDIWVDIPLIGRTAAERLGYPTQKPEALLERIIKASSNEGDVVLDAYCGCGTTVAVAQRLNRRWIGVDVTYQSIALILKRFADTYKDDWPAIEANIKLDGVPKDIESAIALANRKDDKTRKEFEKWAVLSYSDNRAQINDRKGGDGGIDGVAVFVKDRQQNGTLLFSVKSDKVVTPNYVDQLAGTVHREGAELGVLLCLSRPSEGCYKRARSYGQYQHDLFDRQDDKIRIVTVEDMLSGAKLTDWLPMARTDAVKAAAAAGDAGKQATLDL